MWALYETWTTGVNLRLGIPVTDEFTFQPNYSIYQSADQNPEYDVRSRTTIATIAGTNPGTIVSNPTGSRYYLPEVGYDDAYADAPTA